MPVDASYRHFGMCLHADSTGEAQLICDRCCETWLGLKLLDNLQERDQIYGLVRVMTAVEKVRESRKAKMTITCMFHNDNKTPTYSKDASIMKLLGF